MPAPFPPANKRLGQHFLIDQNIVRKIVAVAELAPDDTVLEIGPGRGILTDALSRAARRVVAIEIDAELCALLQARQTDWKNVELICADALIHPFETLAAGVVVANLPYYISTPLLFKFLDQRRRFPRLVLMLQNEVADRLVAKAGDDDYGVLSVLMQYAADVKKAFKVSANCFRPRPDVDSAVVVLRPRPEALLSPGRCRESSWKSSPKPILFEAFPCMRSAGTCRISNFRPSNRISGWMTTCLLPNFRPMSKSSRRRC